MNDKLLPEVRTQIRLMAEQIAEDKAALRDLRAANNRLREAAEDVYTTWAGGEPLDKVMLELGRALGMITDPA